MRKSINVAKLFALILSILLVLCVTCSIVPAFGSHPKATAETLSPEHQDALLFGVYGKVLRSDQNIDDFNPTAGLDGYADYIAGVATTNTNLPIIFLQLEGESQNRQNTTFYYRAQENIGEAGANEQWIQIPYNAAEDEQFAILNTSGIIGADSLYNKYLFFKSVLTYSDGNGTHSVEWVSPRFIDLLVDNSIDNNEYAIESVNATYIANDGMSYFYITDTDRPQWVSTSITFTITSLSKSNNVNHYYSLDDGNNWLPATPVQSDSGEYYSTVTINKDKVLSYDGEVLFSASSESGEIEYKFTARRNIRFDAEEPAFTVRATKNNGTEDYNYGSGSGQGGDGRWSSTDVTYTLDTTDANCLSGARYYYATGSNESGNFDWQEIAPRILNGKNVYSVTFSSSQETLRFYSVSTSGVIYLNNNIDYITNIDKETPQLNIIASDFNGRTITSGGYASDLINFNLNNDNRSNTSAVYYEYMVVGESSGYTRINQDGGSYRLSVEPPVVNKTYRFRLRSQAGLTAEFDFVTYVLSSAISIGMDRLEYATNENGWANAIIPVFINLPEIISEDNEYRIFSAIYGDNTSEKEIATSLAGRFTENGINYKKYRVEIDSSLNGQIMTFYAQNKANSRTSIISTEEIKLDLKVPTCDPVANVTNSAIVLTDNDWANGTVTVSITPDRNLSGLRCFELLSSADGQYEAGREMTANGDGNFVRQIDVTGRYGFRLISGAGLYIDIWKQINIDLTAIEFVGDSIKVMVDGIDIGTDGSVTVASNILVEFLTNHAGHFNFYWQSFTGANPVEGSYVQGSGESFLIEPEISGAAIKKYSFYLESKAVDYTGRRLRTEARTVIISYDVTDFDITITYQGLDAWQESATFTITPPEGVSIMKYQRRLEEKGVWEDINLNQDGQYTFNGLERIYKGVSIGRSYNGIIEFRALNGAGHPSGSVGFEGVVKIDATLPDPFYAFNIAAGETVDAGNGAGKIIYTNNSVSYVNTGAGTAQGKEIFAHMSELTYYYAAVTASGNTAPAPDSFTELPSGGLVFDSGCSYWFYAKNALQTSAPIKYTIIREATAPSATVSGGTIDSSSGIYEFDWSDQAEVTITASSETKVYYWYRLGSGEWIKYNEVAETSGLVKRIVFVASASGSSTAAVVGNVDATVSFKITNQSGSEFEIGDRIRIKIETSAPEFSIETSVVSGIIEPDARDQWYSSAIFIRLIPIAVNPGGVEYFYRTASNAQWEKLPGDGTFFSTDDLVNFGNDKNGEVTIELRAVAKATLYTYTPSAITLRVDKVSPDFVLRGEITVKGTANTKTIVSGEWAQADEITISREALVSSASNVTYTYSYSTSPGVPPSNWSDHTPLTVNQITVLTVVATNQSGLTVTKTFEANMDSTAPIISSGNIHNNYKELPDGTYVIDFDNPNRYYLDQVITFIEPNLKSAKFNNFPLTNGHIVATNTVDNSNGGYVHIVIEDLAGNKTELVFIMTIFDLTVNNITLSAEDLALLSAFETDYLNAKSGLTSSRQAYFEAEIGRLNDRVSTLQKQIEDYRGFLNTINMRVTFDLKSDYNDMYTYINYFTTDDVSILYPQWQQDLITDGVYGEYYNKLLREFNKLEALMSVVVSVQNEVAALPAKNVIQRSDYQAILRVYDAYSSMTIDQKSVFLSTLYNKLDEIKRTCEILLLQDESTGISINGDDLAHGVEIQVLSYDKTTEYVNKAQLALIESFPDEMATTIVSVNQISLAGYGAQYDTGTITITLPIPDAFYSYIVFSVYRLSTDGTIMPVSGSMIAKDGRSVYFEDTSVGTYILATKANMNIEPQEEKIYGVLFGTIEVNGTILTYITFAAVSMFVLLVVIMIIVGIKKRWFLKAYNRAYKRGLKKKGINKIPKGNPPPLKNPANPNEYVSYSDKIYQNKDA